jgi:hypothetical protein
MRRTVEGRGDIVEDLEFNMLGQIFLARINLRIAANHL